MLGIGSYLNQDRTGSTVSYDQSSSGLATGAQREIDEDLFLEIAAQGSWVWINGDNFEQNGYQLGVGAAIKKEIGRFTLSATAGGGFYDYDSTRNYRAGNTWYSAEGNPQGHYVAGEVRATALFGNDRVYAKPGVALFAINTWQNAFTESGVGLLDQRISGLSQANVAVRPAIEVGTTFQVNGMDANAYVRGGLTAFLTDPDVAIASGFADLGVSPPGFSTVLAQDRLIGEFEAGANFIVSDDMTFGVKARGAISDSSQVIAGEARLQIRF